MAGDLPAFSFCHPPEQPRKKSQNLNFSDGYPEVRDPEVRRRQRLALADSLKDYYDGEDQEVIGEEGGRGAPVDALPAPKWLKYDRQVLRFYCYFKEAVDERRDENFRVRKCTIYFYLEDGTLHISEPRQVNSGIVQVLHYFLADDTIEVLEINERNSGRHSFPMLLRRCQLPREIHSDLLGKNMGSDAFPKSAFYNETDLHVGSYVRVYNRDLLLHDCDEFTRNFYKSKYKISDDMLERVDVQEPSPILARMELPPHNGFGSEEDSKQNCISLIPKAPYKDFNKILGLDGKVLCFSARLSEDENHKVVPQDVGRLFVFQYYLADDTISIYEPPCRNSGIQGGKFLSREPAPPKWHGKGPYVAQDMYAGAKIYVHDRIFELLRADEWTMNWMEDHKEDFPMSDYTLVKLKDNAKLVLNGKNFGVTKEGRG